MNLRHLDADSRIEYLQELANAQATYMSRRVFDPVVGWETRRFYPVLAGKIVMEPLQHESPRASESSSADAIAVAERVKLWAQRELEKVR